MSVGRRTGRSVLRTLPAEALFDVHVRHAAAGGATANMRLPGGAQQRVSSLGWLGTLADVVTGRAIMTMTPQNVYCQTVSLRLEMADRPARFGEPLVGNGEVAGLADDFALCKGTIHDEDRHAVAMCTARFALTEVNGGRDVADVVPSPGGLAAEEDLGRVLRLKLLQSEAGKAVFSTSPTQELSNQNGVVHGGVHVSFADVVLSEVVESSAERVAASLLDLTLIYHRPIPIDGTSIRLEGEIDRRGRRVAVASGMILAANGTLLTTVSGTFALKNL